MKLFFKGKDGGPKSHVDGFWLIEAKSLFSIVLLKFNPGTREAYHSHAFDALTFWLKGHVTEYHVDGRQGNWLPSFIPKLTKRNCFHKVYAHETAYALSFRGPWAKTWQEYTPEKVVITLSNGRVIQ